MPTRRCFEAGTLPQIIPILSLFLLSITEVWAQPESPAGISEKPLGVQEGQYSIPYPRRSIYLEKGILAGIALGRNRNANEPDAVFQWEGEASYYYTPYFSAGASGRIVAGRPNDSISSVGTVYTLLARFHQVYRERVAVYIGFDLGIDLMVENTEQSVQSLAWIYRLGSGWKVNRFLGLTIDATAKFSLDGSNLIFETSPGLALDLAALIPALRRQVQAFYAYAEYQPGYVFSQTGRHTRYPKRSTIFGAALAF